MRGPAGITTNTRNVDITTIAGASANTLRSASAGMMSSFWRNLMPSPMSWYQPEAARVHRTEPALHVAHHLEQEDVPEQQRSERDDGEDDQCLDRRRRPPADVEREQVNHRSM